MPEKERGRRDHIIPAAYLAGFCNPNGLLQVCHIKEKRWFPKKPEDVGYKSGFYDYFESVKPDQTADQAFREYEVQFPEIRRDLIASNFSNWRRHLDFLVRYIASGPGIFTAKCCWLLALRVHGEAMEGYLSDYFGSILTWKCSSCVR